MRTIHLARKPLSGTVAQTVLEHGTGALHIEASRIATDSLDGGAKAENPTSRGGKEHTGESQQPSGRWPSNVVLEHQPGCGDACEPGCPVVDLDTQSGDRPSGGSATAHDRQVGIYEDGLKKRILTPYTDKGGASRFFKRVKP